MTSILALLALVTFFALLVRFTSNDRFSAGPRPHDRFRDSDVWIQRDLHRSL